MAKKVTKLLLLSAFFLFAFKGIANATILLLPEKNQNIDGGKAAEEIIKLTNLYRQSHGLNPLVINPRLTQAAINKASDLLAEQYFSHTSPEGKKFSDWVKEVNYDYFYIGENLAIDFSSPQEIFDAWLTSPKHKENLDRSEFQEIGVAYIKGRFKGQETSVVVQLFGSRVLGVSNLNNNGDYSAIANNYFGYQQNKLRAMALTLNYYMDILLLILFIISLPFYFTWRQQLVNANTANPVTTKLGRSDNKRKYLVSADLGTLTTNQSPINQKRKLKQYQVAIEANRIHRR